MNLKIKNNRHQNSYISLLLFCLTMIMLSACSKMDDNYKDFIKKGEIIYTGKVDSLQTFPGKNRIMLKWLLVSDPKITKCKVFWNNGKDSVIMPVKKTTATDTIKVTLDNMAEGLYSFDVYTFDNAGHSSVKADVIGAVYGDNYVGSIFNRPLKSATWLNIAAKPTNTPPILAFKGAELEWFGVGEQAVNVEITYTDELGATQKIVEVPVLDPNRLNSPPAFKPITRLPGQKKGTSFKYRTGYKPSPNSIDIFYTNYDTVLVP